MPPQRKGHLSATAETSQTEPMPQSALIGAFLAGLLGGLHCFAMCGGWIAVVARPARDGPLLPSRRAPGGPGRQRTPGA